MKNQYFFAQKNMKLVELSRFVYHYDFYVWSDGVHDFTKASRLTQK